MKRLIRRLRKGVKTACLTAVLVTCWGVGQSVKATPNFGDQVVVKCNGTISPTTNDLSHVYLLYATGSSGWFGKFFVGLGNIIAGHSVPFVCNVDTEYYWDVGWAILALYGDTSGGQYDENLNGVTVTFYSPSFEGQTWTNVFGSHREEEDWFDCLFNDDISGLDTLLCSGYYGCPNPYNSDSYLDFDDSGHLFDFSTASYNGTVDIHSEIVPEPVTVLLVGAGGIIVWRRRRVGG